MTISFFFFSFTFSKMGFGLATPKTTFEVQPGIAHCQTTSKGCCCLYDLYGAGAEATSNFSEKWRLLAHSHNSFNDFSIIYIYIYSILKSQPEAFQLAHLSIETMAGCVKTGPLQNGY